MHSPGEMSALGEKGVGVVACSRTPLASYTCMARLSLYAGPSKGGPLQGRSLNIAEPRPSVCSGRREWRRPSRQHPKSQTAIACMSVRRWRHAGSPLLDGFKFGDGPRRKRSIEGFWKTGLRGEGEWLEWMDGQMGAASPAPPKPPGQARAAPLLGHRSSQGHRPAPRQICRSASHNLCRSQRAKSCLCVLAHFTYKLSNVNQRDNSHVSLPPTTPNLGGTSLSPSAIFLLAKMPHQSVEYRTVLGGSPSWGMSIVWANGPGLREVRPAMSPNPYCSQSSDPQRGHHLRHDACRRAREQQRRLKRPINCRRLD